MREYYFQGVEGYVTIEDGAEVRAGDRVYLVYLEDDENPVFGLACRDCAPDGELLKFLRKEWPSEG